MPDPRGNHAKKKTLIAAERQRERTEKLRKQWRRSSRRLHVSRCWFLDESAADTRMMRTYGRAVRGSRVYGHVPNRHWKSFTMLSAINVDGRMPTMVFDGTADITAMLSYLDWLLLPELRPGDIVVLDNLGCHKSTTVIDRIRSVGADVRFLPPYSPDWNPIEHIWSKIKSYLAAAAAPTGKRLVNAIGRALKTISNNDIANCIRHCGYNMSTIS